MNFIKELQWLETIKINYSILFDYLSMKKKTHNFGGGISIRSLICLFIIKSRDLKLLPLQGQMGMAYF